MDAAKVNCVQISYAILCARVTKNLSTEGHQMDAALAASQCEDVDIYLRGSSRAK